MFEQIEKETRFARAVTAVLALAAGFIPLSALIALTIAAKNYDPKFGVAGTGAIIFYSSLPLWAGAAVISALAAFGLPSTRVPSGLVGICFGAALAVVSRPVILKIFSMWLSLRGSAFVAIGVGAVCSSLLHVVLLRCASSA